jgi:hypothetical protein
MPPKSLFSALVAHLSTKHRDRVEVSFDLLDRSLGRLCNQVWSTVTWNDYNPGTKTAE